MEVDGAMSVKWTVTVGEFISILLSLWITSNVVVR